MLKRTFEQIADNPLTDLYAHIQEFVNKRLWLRVLIAMVLGVGLGAYFATNPSWLDERQLSTIINWIAFPGNLFIRVVQMIMIPLMFTSVVQGIAGGDNKDFLFKTGTKVIGFFGITTVIALILAVIIALALHPGTYMDATNMITEDMKINSTATEAPSLSLGNIPTMIVDLIPANPLQSLISGDMLSIVIFALIIGISLVNIPSVTAKPLLGVVFSVQEITMSITRWAMKIVPAAVFGLLCQVTSQVGINTISGLSMFMLTVFIGLMAIVLLYVIILIFFARVNIGKFFSDSREALLLAFSMASSAAVMPLTLKTAEEKMGIDPSVSRFVIPIGVSLNMAGTAVFQAIATLFLAQVYGLHLELISIIIIIITTILASIGTPSAPGAGVIVLGSVLATIGIPATAIALIIGVDRLMGMLRSSVNVMGDLVTCHVFESRQKKKNITDESISELQNG